MKAIVYNRYMSGLGGGERSAFSFALALQKLGYDTEIVCDSQAPSDDRIRASFGDEFDECKITSIPSGLLGQFVGKRTPDVFVNHTFNSLERNYGRLGIYAMMFPAIRINNRLNRGAVASLAAYNYFLCNSSFTKSYTDSFWELPPGRTSVLHPPIGQQMSRQAHLTSVDPPIKERLFLGIGRFATYPANKNQKVLIECFLEARRRNPTLASWKMVLVGNRNPDEASNQYFEECAQLARNSCGAVEIQDNVSQSSLIELLNHAFGYVHAAGAFLPPGMNPHQCEHLGLSIVEGMAYGCLPILYARGGVFDVLDVGEAGFPYATREGLIDAFSASAELYGTGADLFQQKAVARMAGRLSFDNFIAGLGDLIKNSSTLHV